jgi:hypothetical protein
MAMLKQIWNQHQVSISVPWNLFWFVFAGSYVLSCLLGVNASRSSHAGNDTAAEARAGNETLPSVEV